MTYLSILTTQFALGVAFGVGPHPELGRAYGIGRTFARHCNCSHELAAIECGAKAYMEQLPRMLELLRGLTVV